MSNKTLKKKSVGGKWKDRQSTEGTE